MNPQSSTTSTTTSAQTAPTKNPPDIYRDEHGTWVCFGSGTIVIARTEDSEGQQAVWMGDSLTTHKIGLNAGVVDWKKEVQGQTVILGFNKPESIDVLVECLMVAREALVKNLAKEKS